MEAGALATPLNELFFQYWEPQKFTVLPLTIPLGIVDGGVPADRSPTTKPPALGADATITVDELLEDP
jgi:hypothetical protein